MTDQASDAAPSAARNIPIVIAAQYLRDLSFESPGVPATLGAAAELRDGSVAVDARVVPLGGQNYEIILKVRVEAVREAKIVYLLEMEYAGIAQIGNVPADAVERLLFIEGPRLLFPYARAIVTEMTRDGGFAPLLINPIDFAALYRDYKRRTEAAPPSA